ncbi:unnamed protein product [Closterium sp. Naga37s-1]|nr:unnamed protein product [Closterium sp. Naga37s-1]
MVVSDLSSIRVPDKSALMRDDAPCDCAGCTREGETPSGLVAKALELNGFPKDLMPAHHIQHCYGDASGPFRIYLDQVVEKEICGYPIRFETEISGTIENGWIRKLQGIRLLDSFLRFVKLLCQSCFMLSFSIQKILNQQAKA